jgi:hypothetical protein
MKNLDTKAINFKNTIVKNIILFISIYLIIFTIINILSFYKKSYSSYLLNFKVRCEFNSYLDITVRKFGKPLMVELVNPIKCANNYVNPTYTFIAPQAEIDLFFVNQFFKNDYNEIIQQKIYNEIRQINSRVNILKNSNDPIFKKQTKIDLKRITVLKDLLKTDSKYIEILSWKKIEKIEFFSYKFSFYVTSTIYVISVFILFLFRNKSFGFFFK